MSVSPLWGRRFLCGFSDEEVFEGGGNRRGQPAGLSINQFSKNATVTVCGMGVLTLWWRRAVRAGIVAQPLKPERAVMSGAPALRFWFKLREWSHPPTP